MVFQAAQATFKSIKAVVPLLDRVLVQKFKPDTVRVKHASVHLVIFIDLLFSVIENCVWYLPTNVRHEHSSSGGDRHCCWPRRPEQGGHSHSDNCEGRRPCTAARMGWKLDKGWRGCKLNFLYSVHLMNNRVRSVGVLLVQGLGDSGQDRGIDGLQTHYRSAELTFGFRVMSVMGQKFTIIRILHSANLLVVVLCLAIVLSLPAI